jgi:hypothetical protein
MQSLTAHKLEVYQPPNLSRETKERTLLLGAFLSRYRAAMALLCLDRQLPSIESIAVDLTGGIPDSYCVWRPFLQCKPRLFRPFLFALEKSVEEMGCHGVGVWKSRGSVDFIYSILDVGGCPRYVALVLLETEGIDPQDLNSAGLPTAPKAEIPYDSTKGHPPIWKSASFQGQKITSIT